MPASTGVLSGFITSAPVRVDHMLGNKPATTVDTIMIFGRKRKLTVLRSNSQLACGRRNERLDRVRIIARPETTPDSHPSESSDAWDSVDRRRVRFLMRSSFLRACAHLKWNVHFTHWLVDLARL